MRFLRQKVIDFYCHDARLILELDGSQHYEEEKTEKDLFCTQQLEKRNLMVVRIPNNEIMKNFRGVCEYIDFLVKERTGIPQSPPVR